MLKNGLIPIAIVILAAVAASPAMADREGRGGYGSGPGNVADIAGVPDLNLSPEQAERIGALHAAHRKEILPLQERLMGKSRQLRELWLARTPDREKILALQREVHDLRGQLLEKLATYRLEVLRILTPEQQTRVQAFEAERRRGPMGPPGMGRGPFPGWREGGHPPMGTPREKRPGPSPKAGVQEEGEPSGPANR